MYRFPNQINGWEDFGAVIDSTQLTRLDNGFAHVDMNYIDLLWKYAPGNEWIHHNEQGMAMYGAPYDGAYKTITHDSVINSSLLNANSVIVNFLTRRYWVGGWQQPTFNNPYWDSTVGSSVTYHTDTISNTTANIVADAFHPELLRPDQQMSDANQELSLHSWYFADTMCNRPTFRAYSLEGNYIDYINNCWVFGNGVSGGATSTEVILHGFGPTSKLIATSGFILNYGTLDYYRKQYHSYLKLPGCTSGTKIDVIALDAQSIAQVKPVINVYPNPTAGPVCFQSSYIDPGASVCLTDMTGKVLLQQQGLQYTNSINVKSIAQGMYLLHAITGRGTTVAKIVIQ
jgi:hypothetical protein